MKRILDPSDNFRCVGGFRTQGRIFGFVDVRGMVEMGFVCNTIVALMDSLFNKWVGIRIAWRHAKLLMFVDGVFGL
jgi:hypothetical protein